MITLDQGGRAAERAVSLPVGGAAGRLVESAWLLRGSSVDAGRSARDSPAPRAGGSPQPAPADGWRVVPDVHPHVIVAAFPSGRVRIHVVGARSTWVDVDQAARTWTLGVRLHPGALPGLTGLPAPDFLDGGASVADVFGPAGREVTTRVAEAPDAAAAAGVVLAFVERRAAAAPAPDWKVRGLMAGLRRRPGARVGALAAGLGVAPRTLRVALRDHVGLAPKTAQRIVRLQRALTRAGAADAPGGAAVARAAGYTDQAHFIHDCQDLLGETPGAFLRRGVEDGQA